MKIIGFTQNDKIATVYLADIGNEHLIEFVEAIQPPLSRKEKWVLVISTLYGCPVGCPICDAGYYYKGCLSEQELLAQICFLIRKRFPDGKIPSKQFKIQFSRMGEPAFNPNVLSLLQNLPNLIDAPGLMPSISTIAPNSTDNFFNELLLVKRAQYNKGNFQLQFSLHSTDTDQRDELIPIKKWGFEKIARYGRKFYQPGDRKITLNFVLTSTTIIEPETLLRYFDNAIFIIKITPLNPTYRAQANDLSTGIDPNNNSDELEIMTNLRQAGYDVIVSIGESEENLIGSNCGQYVQTHLQNKNNLSDGYEYPLIYLDK
ncbi:MAG: radical SAM protein [Candidatus Marinimicrobia bacterium]|nr:radical SAM protein [Candidatus Neomarinimicrobiota bacterium]